MCYVVGLSSLSKVKKFLFFFLSRNGERGCVFAVFFTPVPEKEILDFIAHGSLTQVSTMPDLNSKVSGHLDTNCYSSWRQIVRILKKSATVVQYIAIRAKVWASGSTGK